MKYGSIESTGTTTTIGQDQASGAITLRFRSTNSGLLQWNPTANRTITLPDVTGTIALTSDLAGYFPIAGGTLTGTTGAGFVGLPNQSSNPATPASGVRIFANSTGSFAWKNSGGFTRTLGGTITADRGYTLPDATGTLALTTLLSAATAAVTFNDQSISRYTIPVNSQSGTTYTIAATDNGLQILCSAGCTVTIPSGLVVGFSCIIRQTGTSQVTVTAGSGVTLQNADAQFKTAKQYAALQIISSGTSNVFFVDGYSAA